MEDEEKWTGLHLMKEKVETDICVQQGKVGRQEKPAGQETGTVQKTVCQACNLTTQTGRGKCAGINTGGNWGLRNS